MHLLFGELATVFLRTTVHGEWDKMGWRERLWEGRNYVRGCAFVLCI